MADKSPSSSSVFKSHNTELYGFYRQNVISTEDELKAGRIQVNIYGLTEGIDNNDLPWAEPLFLFAGEDYGDVKIPQVGSEVVILFEAGNIYRPFYFQQIAKNTSKGYLPDYNNYKKENQANVFITKYPKQFSSTNQFEKIIIDEQDTASVNILSPYYNNRFTLQVQNNQQHQNHITIQYRGNDTIISEISTSNSSNFTISHGNEFGGYNNIILSEDSSGSNVDIYTTNSGIISEIKLSQVNVHLTYNNDATFLYLTAQNAIIGGVSVDSAHTLQYKNALQALINAFNEFITLYNTHTHIGNLGAPTTPPIPTGQPAEILPVGTLITKAN